MVADLMGLPTIGSAASSPPGLRNHGYRDMDNTNLQLGPPTVKADNWRDALMTMLGGALGVTGPLGGAGIIGSLVGSDMLGQQPSISPTQVLRRAASGDGGPPVKSDRDITAELLSAPTGVDPGFDIQRNVRQDKLERVRQDKGAY